MLNMAPGTFLEQTRASVGFAQIAFGLVKSTAFGALIAIVGCRSGLRAGRGAADVGQAATKAVVMGIVGVIALDAVFAVCANALDFSTMTCPGGIPKPRVEGLAFGYDDTIVQHDISFSVGTKSIFAIMGASGSCKSTLMKTMVSLLKPSAGTMYMSDEDYWAAAEERRAEIGRRFGVVFQAGELPSLPGLCDDRIFLDSETKTAIASGSPRAALETSDLPAGDRARRVAGHANR
jgi:hypothetical protein